jgi:hypothetical protein
MRMGGIISYPGKSPLIRLLLGFERHNLEISPPIPSHPYIFYLNQKLFIILVYVWGGVFEGIG